MKIANNLLNKATEEVSRSYFEKILCFTEYNIIYIIIQI